MKILITGANGQLGWELRRTAPEDMEVIALERKALDICDANRVQEVFRGQAPNIVINTAAYTAVDKAEKESDFAYRVNRDGAAILAQYVALYNAQMVHISTDYVFDGTQGRPYKAEDRTNPQCVYGSSKRAGEKEVLKILEDQVSVIRTSWVYSSHGKNFVKTMLRLMQEREQLNVVSDQIGTPTWARNLAEMIWSAIAMHSLAGIDHWTDAGVASWYDFAIAIQEEALLLGLLEKPVKIRPTMTWQYPLPAKRPGFSLLDKTDTWSKLNRYSNHWRVSLRRMLKEIHASSA